MAFTESLMQRRAGERPLACVPRGVVALLLVALVAQVAWQTHRQSPAVTVTALPRPPAPAALAVAGLGDRVMASRLLMLWLQAYDYQPGVSLPFKELDYERVVAWLDAILALDPGSHYPLLSAARIYTQVPDTSRQRRMLDFVYREFLQDPARRWPWLAHAVFVARYKVRDTELALRYARAIRQNVPVGQAPDWAMQMELLILADMGEAESARVLLGGLLESGVISDKNQLEFLKQRLAESKAAE